MAKWTKLEKGIRYREHATRRHGARKDRYYVFRRTVKGHSFEEAVGWASEGWKEKEVRQEFHELEKNVHLGTPPYTLKERREMQAAEEAELERSDQQEAREGVTVSEFCISHYFPLVKVDRKNKNSLRTEEGFFRNWIEPVIGKKPIKKIVPLDLERIKKNMSQRSGRTVEHVLAITRQIFAEAIEQDFYHGKNPARGGKKSPVKRPKFDNKRERYLTRDEAATLLAKLATRSQDIHDMALLSLHTGMRAGEIFSLAWGCIDFEMGNILILDAKNGESRYTFLNDITRAMLHNRQPGKPSELVFKGKNGQRIGAISRTFKGTVDKLGLNTDVDDRRQRVVFHTLRHTFASNLVQNKVDIFRVQKLLGHKDIKLTMRYAHIGSEDLRAALAGLAGM